MYNTAIGFRVAATGQVVAAGARVYGYVINAGAGQFVLRDGGAGGTTKWDCLGIAAVFGIFNTFPVPIRFQTDLHVTVPAAGDITLLVDPG